MIDPDLLGSAFRAQHGRTPRIFAAPGRVNLIGEHTDYNDGFVLPIALDRGVLVAAAPRTDRRVTVRSLDLDASAAFDLEQPAPVEPGRWSNYVEGVARALLARGVAVGGADLVLGSDVPTGAGLSSSAALEMATGLALATLAGAEPDRVTLALAGQAAEHQYVGTRCGIMDQYISALGRPEHALLIDCRSLAATPVALAMPDAVIVVCDSKVKHELASSAYNTRRAECEAGVRALREVLPGIRALRDVSEADFARCAARLPEPVRQRCRHVVSENARTLAAAEALARGALARAGAGMNASHASLRDDYAVSCPELDVLAAAAQAVPGVAGSRMTGGGFGGCTVSIVAANAVEALREAVTRAYRDRFDATPALFVTRACAGARELS